MSEAGGVEEAAAGDPTWEVLEEEEAILQGTMDTTAVPHLQLLALFHPAAMEAAVGVLIVGVEVEGAPAPNRVLQALHLPSSLHHHFPHASGWSHARMVVLVQVASSGVSSSLEEVTYPPFRPWVGSFQSHLGHCLSSCEDRIQISLCSLLLLGPYVLLQALLSSVRLHSPSFLSFRAGHETSYRCYCCCDCCQYCRLISENLDQDMLMVVDGRALVASERLGSPVLQECHLTAFDVGPCSKN